MTTARATTRRTTLEKRREHVLADLLDGMGTSAVAQKYKVQRTSVIKFAERHKGELEVASRKLELAVEDFAISKKAYRIQQLAYLYNASVDFLTAQGFSERVTRYNRDGDVVSQTERYRSDAMAQLRGLLDDAAREMNDRGKGDTTNVVAGVINIIRGGTPLGMAPVDHSLIVEGSVLPISESADDSADTQHD